jgi:hypothetical protein
MSLTDKKPLLASQVIEIDKAFIMEVAKQIKDVDVDDKDLLWSVNDVAKEKGANPQTVRRHIRNYVNDEDVSPRYRLKATLFGKEYLATKADVEEYLGRRIGTRL